MSSDVILKVENIAKQYRLGLVGTGTISHDLNRWWSRVRGKEDPYLKIGEANDRSAKGNSEYVWALKDISFDVKKGEVLGIIGKNGAGKSTLLKILSRVTSPTVGEIKTKGRIASLLEVGTGFHPEMTGRENIYLNGAILGMNKAEITSKIDEIIEFSGCIRYVDTPVKRYSSGMKVRLAFAVAAHLEPDILVVDEVLAVGDAEFQKKAIGKMQDISNTDGRTVLFVSHNMAAVKSLCSSCIVLNMGSVSFKGTTEEAIDYYIKNSYQNQENSIKLPLAVNNASLIDFSFKDEYGNDVPTLILGNKYLMSLRIKNTTKAAINYSLRIQFFDRDEVLLTTYNTYFTDSSYLAKPNEEFTFECTIQRFLLPEGEYNVGIKLVNVDIKELCYQNDNFVVIEGLDGDFYGTGKIPNRKNTGKFLSEFEWKIIKSE